MAVTTQEVQKIARLARIAMSEEDAAALAPELNKILGFVEQLEEVDTSSVAPMAAVIPNTLRLREDVVTDGNVREKALANAPARQGAFFGVPKVIE